MLKSGLISCGLVLFALGCVAEPSNVTLNPSGGNTGGAGGGGNTGGAGASMNTGGTGAGGPSGNAKQFFLDNVEPAITPVCASCHIDASSGAPICLASTPEGSYNAMEAAGYIVAPANSQLVIHGVHTGPALTPDQESVVSTWLDMEVAERGIGGGGGPGDPPGPTSLEVLAEIGQCMDYNDWIETGMPAVAQQTTEEGPCNSCHNAGDGGAWLSLNSEEFFEKNQVHPYSKRLFNITLDEAGQPNMVIPALRFIQKGQTPCAQNENCHPAFNMNTQNVQAVTEFVQLTIDRWMADECDLALGPDEVLN